MIFSRNGPDFFPRIVQKNVLEINDLSEQNNSEHLFFVDKFANPTKSTNFRESNVEKVIHKGLKQVRISDTPSESSESF